MVINNYVVTMNAQYFNLKNATTETEVTTQTDEFNKNTSSKINALDMEISKEKKSDSELSKELSKALLKNLRFKSKTTPIDRVEVTQTYEEKQALNFQVQALIQTDTQELQLSVDVSLSRSFIHKSTLNYEELVMQLTDPLVLSLNGSMPTLSTDTFAFDIRLLLKPK